MDIITKTYKRATDDSSPLALSELADVFEELRSTYAEEYALYNLSSLAGPLLVPPMRRVLSDWTPLRDPQGPTQAMRAWRGLLRSEKLGGAAASVGGDAVAFVREWRCCFAWEWIVLPVEIVSVLLTRLACRLVLVL